MKEKNIWFRRKYVEENLLFKKLLGKNRFLLVIDGEVSIVIGMPSLMHYQMERLAIVIQRFTRVVVGLFVSCKVHIRGQVVSKNGLS